MKTRVDKDKQASKTGEDLPSEVESIVPPTRPGQLSLKNFSELRLLYLIIGSIFLAEVVAMFLIYELPPLPYLYTSLIDAGVMTLLIFPVLYFLSFRPLIKHIRMRQQAEERLRRVNRALAVLNQCNQVLVHSDNETGFLQKMCEIIVNVGEYCMAWIGFAEQDQARSVRPAAQLGFESGYLDLAQITWADNDRGRGPTGTAIREGVVQVNQNFLTNPKMAPWRESALLRGYQSSIALPLHDETSTFGALMIYSALPEAFDEDEVRLLNELANDLAFGITALRVRAERDRAQEQAREMALFPALNPGAVLRVDASGRIEKTNPAANQMGFCVGTRLAEILPDLSELDMSACIATGGIQPVQQEARLGERILLWTVQGVPDLGLAFMYSVDITERKRAETAVRQLSSIVEQTEDTVVVTNNDGVIEYVNPAFERLTGYTKEEALGKTPRVIKSQIHDPAFYQDLWNTILKGEVFQSEIANCKKNGELFYEVKTITPLRNAQGSITHFVATGKDITEHKLDEEKLLRAYDELELRVEERTEQLKIANAELEREIGERKEAEEAVRQSEVMMRAVLEQMPSGVTVRDARTGELVFSNVRSLEILNGLADIPEQFAEYRGFHPDGRVYQNDEWPIYRSMSTGEVVNEEEIECERSDGARFTLVASSAPIYGREGEIVNGVGVFHDITERKQVERRLAYLASFPERNPNLVIEVDFEGQVRYANPATLNAFPDLLELGRAHPWLAGLDTILHAFRKGQTNTVSRDTVVGERVYQQSFYPLPQDRLIRIYSTNITERKHAEEALRESERRLNRAQEIAHLGSWELDLVNNRLTWSDEVYCIFGLQPQEFVASYQAFLEAVHPDDRAAVDDAYSRSIREGRDNYEIEHRIVKRSSGEVCIVHEKCEHFRDDTGQIVRSVGMVHDITERKRAQQALFESEEKYRLIADNANDWIYWIKPNGSFQYISPSCERVTGYTSLEFMDNPHLFLDIVHPEDQGRVETHLGNVREENEAHYLDYRIFTKTNEVRWISHSCDLVYAPDSKYMGRAGTNRDITDRKQAEEALRRAHDELELRVQERTRELVKEIAERKEIERQLRIQTTAMEAAANGIVITDRQGNIQWTNPALSQISGYDAYDLIGQSTHIFNSGQHDATYYRQMWDTILSGQVWQGEITNRRKDGTYYIEEQTITPVRDENGQIPHFIAIKQDITQRKQAAEELGRRNVELQIIGNAERNQRQFSEALVAAALILNSSLKLNEVLPLILNQIREVIPYQLADIALLEGDSFYDACHHGDLAWPATLMGMNNRFLMENFPLLDEMRQSGEPILVLDSQQQPDWVTIEGLGWVRSLLSAPLLVEKKVMGFVNLFSDQPGFFTQEMSNRLVAFATHAAVAIQNAWLFEQIQASTERLQSLSRRLVEIQENERLYISRELHDEAGQVLTSLLVDLRLLEQNVSEPNVLLKIVTEMESSLNAVIENLHRVAMALRPASLDHVGLVSALRQHVESVGEKHGLSASFRSSGVMERLPSNVETVLYRIVQEALTNVIRHAHATRVDVVLTVRDEKLIVIVEDDGVGFELDAVSTGDHLGLFGMRERTEMIDGKLVIESAPGKGTTIMMEVSYVDTVTSRR